MSYSGNSGLSQDSHDARYKRALKEINKLLNATKVLKEENEENRRELQGRLDDMESKFIDAAEECRQERTEKESLEKYLQELQENHSNLQKELHASEKELSYLNQTIADQKEELQKIPILKGEQKIGSIIRSYEEESERHWEEKQSWEKSIKRFKDQVVALDEEVEALQRAKQEVEDKYFLLENEISRYR